MVNNIVPYNQGDTLKKPVVAISEEDKNKIKVAIDKWSIQAKSNKTHHNVRSIAERDKLLVEWLFNTGMRISDALSIKYRDIDMKNETVTFIVKKRSKNHPYVHTISLDKAILFEVQRYKEMLCLLPDSLLFDITRGTFDMNLKAYCELAGIQKYSAHKFRHGCAMKDLTSGQPDFVTAFRLAHSNTGVTNSTYRRMTAEIEREFRSKKE